MSQPSQEPVPTQIAFEVPPELESGVFANFAGIWQDPDSIVIDFAAVASAPQQVQVPDGPTVTQVRARVVSRVRIPPRQAIELMRGLGNQLDAWEQGHGPVTPTQEQ